MGRMKELFTEQQEDNIVFDGHEDYSFFIEQAVEGIKECIRYIIANPHISDEVKLSCITELVREQPPPQKEDKPIPF